MLTDKQIIDCASWLNKHKLKFGTYNMLCLPGETIEDALQTFKIGLQRNPSFKDAIKELGSFLIEEGIYEEALLAYKELIRLDTEYIFGLDQVAWLQTNLGKYDEAIMTMKRAKCRLHFPCQRRINGMI